MVGANSPSRGSGVSRGRERQPHARVVARGPSGTAPWPGLACPSSSRDLPARRAGRQPVGRDARHAGQPRPLHAAVPSERAPGPRCAADPRHPAPASVRSRHRRLLSRGRRDGHGVLERWGGRDQTPPRFEDPTEVDESRRVPRQCVRQEVGLHGRLGQKLRHGRQGAGGETDRLLRLAGHDRAGPRDLLRQQLAHPRLEHGRRQAGRLDLADQGKRHATVGRHDAEPGEVFMPQTVTFQHVPLSRSGSPGESRHWHRTGPRGSGPGTRQGSGCPRHGPGFARSYRFCASSHRCPPHKDPDLEEQLKCQSTRAWAHGDPFAWAGKPTSQMP